MQAATQMLTANIFRDMSNAGAAAELAKKSLEEASKGSTESQKVAQEAYKAALEHQREMTRVAADAAAKLAPFVMPALGGVGAAGGLGAALAGGGGGLGPAMTGGGLSKVGAVMNLAGKLDGASKDGKGVGSNVRAVLDTVVGRASSNGGDSLADWLIPVDEG
jgi:hypothetical protein